MQNPKIDTILALHIKPDLQFGSIALSDGPIMAAAIHFHIRITGHGGHGARPDLAHDPLPAAHALYGALQTVRRSLAPTVPCVLSVCAFNAGETYNIIPATADLQGTLRTYTMTTQRQVCATIRALASNIARAFKVQAKASFTSPTLSVVNHIKPVTLMRQAAGALHMPLYDSPLLMVSEDFAYYQKHAKGALAWLGTLRGHQARDLHTPSFDFDENILAHGAALLTACALKHNQ